MKEKHFFFFLLLLFVLFRRRQPVIVADYVTRGEFNDLKKDVAYLREEMDAQYFG